MAEPKAYEKNGRTYYRASVYIGVDELTGTKRLKRKSGFDSRAACALWITRTELAAQGESMVNLQSMTFGDVYEQWAATYQNAVRASSWRDYQSTFKRRILPALGHIKLQKLTMPLLQRVVNEWAKTGRLTYASWYRRTLMVLKYARQQRYMAHDPSQGIILPKVQAIDEDTQENFYSRDEMRHFFSLFDQKRQPKWFTLFRLLAFSGLRRSEALALTWNDIDFTDSTVSVTKTISIGGRGELTIQPPKTSSGRRVVPLDAETMAILKHWRMTQVTALLARGINANKPGQLVFSSQRNTWIFPTEVGNWLRAFQAKHDLTHRITVHGFRHSHATALIAAGVPVKVVQARLGHKSIKTTLGIYAHATQEQTSAAADQVAAYLGF